MRVCSLPALTYCAWTHASPFFGTPSRLRFDWSGHKPTQCKAGLVHPPKVYRRAQGFKTLRPKPLRILTDFSFSESIRLLRFWLLHEASLYRICCMSLLAARPGEALLSYVNTYTRTHGNLWPPRTELIYWPHTGSACWPLTESAAHSAFLMFNVVQQRGRGDCAANNRMALEHQKKKQGDHCYVGTNGWCAGVQHHQVCNTTDNIPEHTSVSICLVESFARCGGVD